MRRIFKRLALVAFGVAIGLVVVEIGLRLLGVSYPLPFAADPHTGVRLRPNFSGWWTKEGRGWIEVNQFGFRHGDITIPKPPNSFRVAVLGDSFVEAFQVDEDDSLCHQLEQRLSKCPRFADRDVQVLNFGVSGFGTAQELQILRHYVWQYEPDAILLAFFSGNDLRNNSPTLESDYARPFFRLRDEELVLNDEFLQHPDFMKSQQTLTKWKVSAINRLRTLQLVNEIRNRKTGGTTDGSARTSELASAKPQDDHWVAAWELTERLILEVWREAKMHSTDFWLVTVSNDFQVHPDADVRASVANRLGVTDLFYSERRLERLGEKNRFPVVALAEPMQRHAIATGTYFHGFDNTRLGYGHWNKAGHRFAAKIIASRLCPGATVGDSDAR